LRIADVIKYKSSQKQIYAGLQKKMKADQC